jgi:hypothetical protein
VSARCQESFAGITVPEGDPGALEAAAGEFGALAGQLSGLSAQLRGMPGTLTSWSGPASVTYAGACLTNGSACETAVTALGQAERAARVYAAALEAAQKDAERAIDDARDAQERIDRAEREIEAAQARQAAAALAAAAASTEIGLSALTGTPSPGAQANLDRAHAEEADAAADEARARRELDRARDDLERAKRRGERAEDDARDAGRAAAAGFSGAAGLSPAYVMLGGPATAVAGSGGAPSWWNTTNDGAQWFNEDAFVGGIVPFHPRNDAFGRYKWVGDQGTGQAFYWGEKAAEAYAVALGRRAVWTETTTRFSSGSGRFGPVSFSWTRVSRTTDTVIDASTLASAAKWGKVGKALPIVGTAAGMGSAAWDQWNADASNPSYTSTDRVGRAAGVGVYVGGAAAGGAALGTMIFPGVGTLAGAGIGAAGGLIVGAAASAWEPGKELAADVGQGVANFAVDTYNTVDSGLQTAESAIESVDAKIDEGIDAAGDFIADKMPDVDMPDLNPF